MRVPLPAARMTAFIFATDEHRWTQMKTEKRQIKVLPSKII